MPFLLPPISRRRFISRSLATIAGSLLTQRNLLAKAETDDASWILLSDTHIDADRFSIAREVNMTTNLEHCIKESLATLSHAAGVILSGDCAHVTGNKADYETFGATIKPLREAGLPVHLLLGNHDDRANFLDALAADAAPSPVEHRVVACIESPAANWFLLDSLDKVNSTPGRLGAEQLGWLQKALDAKATKPAIIVVHHNVVTGGNKPVLQNAASVSSVVATLSKPPQAALQDSADLLDVLRPRKHVKAIIYGHTHVWDVKPDDSGIHLVNLPPTSYVFAPGMPSGWVHAALRADGMKLELRCLDASHRSHGEMKDLVWR
ncbi:MAG: metallophosphoesterase [Verrucomicrobiaceae bacterium]